ncbi:MAG: winged helix-turn-helix transcriptional regulator [Allorhizobium sp.]|uniref:Transcriptional regulator n=1 Tax=Rhizobium rosettiformans TaxID=1368430 RepID=A0ABX7EQN6_9HYPH|nr:helix-turn-helix domain-containing protein [Rhizobium rosettiformans]QRF50201.1 transcriptional regulator [Rhizobium rosettiformans]
MCDNYDPNKCQTVSEMLARLGDKWTVLVIMMLGDGPQRFSDLKRSVVGISQRMLTLTLRALERDGIVERTVHPTVPPKVEYALTDLGRSFGEPIRALGGWVFTHHERIQTARAEFDLRNEVDAGNKLIKLG